MTTKHGATPDEEAYWRLLDEKWRRFESCNARFLVACSRAESRAEPAASEVCLYSWNSRIFIRPGVYCRSLPTHFF